MARLTPAAHLARLREIVVDLHWMARRYANGRQSYAVGLFNRHTRALLALGVPLNATADETIWARDAQGSAYDGLSDAEALPGTPEARGDMVRRGE